MKYLIAFMMITGLFSSSYAIPEFTTDVVYRGEARDEDDNLVYREKHTVKFVGDRVLNSLTEYMSPDGELIATMESDYSKSVAMPTYLFEDKRTGYREGLRLIDDSYMIFTHERGKNEKVKPLKSTDNVFSCQGWHYYLVNNLDRLAEGNVDLNLILPSELKAYGFEVEQVGSDGNLVNAVLKLDNWFFRIFAPELKLVYDRELRKLVRYEGISNIQDKKGDNQDVIITYSYD